MKYLNLDIDHFLIEEIEAGRAVLTDELFYKLLEKSSDHLGTTPFLNRIREWQDQLEDEYDKEKRRVLKTKLRDIAKALVSDFDDRGNQESREPTHNQNDIGMVHQFDQIVEILGDFVERAKRLTFKKQRELFEKDFPGWKQYKPFENKSYRETSALARHILSKQFNIPPTKLSSILKSGREILEATRSLKPSK
jgi:hypothetical protein